MFLKYPIICSHVHCYSNISLTPPDKNRGQGLGGGPARKQFEADDVEADDFNAMLSVIPNGTGSFFRFK